MGSQLANEGVLYRSIIPVKIITAYLYSPSMNMDHLLYLKVHGRNGRLPDSAAVRLRLPAAFTDETKELQYVCMCGFREDSSFGRRSGLLRDRRHYYIVDSSLSSLLAGPFPAPRLARKSPLQSFLNCKYCHHGVSGVMMLVF